MRQDFKDIAEGRRPLPNCAKTLGGQVLDHREGYIKVRFQAVEGFYNMGNVVQGGFLAAMLDDTMGPAVISTMAEDESHATVDLHVQFLRPARAGPLVGEANVTLVGRVVRLAEAVLTREDGKVVARASSTSVVRKNPTDGPSAD
ncbi:MAG: PaaI family thioesterase [Dehalococcoidia bacterium]